MTSSRSEQVLKCLKTSATAPPRHREGDFGVKVPKSIPNSSSGLKKGSPEKQVCPAVIDWKSRNAIREAKEAQERLKLEKKWAWKADGTPETLEGLSKIPSRRRQWPMDRMLSLGTISRDEHQAAEQILRVFEIIQRDVSIGSVSLEVRVDYSGSANDYLAETIGRIRAEYTYSAWRKQLVKPAGLVIDMITTNQSYVGIARRYRMDWKTARKRLLTALRLWNSLWIAAKQEVTGEDVNEVYPRLG